MTFAEGNGNQTLATSITRINKSQDGSHYWAVQVMVLGIVYVPGVRGSILGSSRYTEI